MRSRPLLVWACCAVSFGMAHPGGAKPISPSGRLAFPADPPLPVPRPDLTAPPVPGPPAAPAAPQGAAPAPPERAAPAPNGPAEGMSAPGPGHAPDAIDCPSRLKAANVDVERTTVGPQPNPQCSVVDAVHLTALKLASGAVVTFPDKPTIACATASTFSAFVRDLLSPLAKGTYGAPVEAVWTGPGLDCRTRDHLPGAKLSAHGQGLAVDIAELKLQDGHRIEVGRPASDADRAFETAALAGGCGYFHTALGPGADAFHETHWHLDLVPRGAKGDAKFCQ